MKNRNLTLIGMSGAGKSTIGKRLAARLGLEFVDGDVVLAKHFGADIQTILEALGDEDEYLPDRIVAKKTVQWKDFYLVHWLGFTAAERTWEPAAFFDQYCTK